MPAGPARRRSRRSRAARCRGTGRAAARADLERPSGGSRAAAGSSMTIRVPPLGRCSARIVPPCASTRSRAMARPRPVPSDPGPFANRSKTRGSSSAGMPGPGVRHGQPLIGASAAADARPRTEPPAGVCRSALATRLREDAARAAPGRAATGGRSARHRPSSVTPALASARPAKPGGHRRRRGRARSTGSRRSGRRAGLREGDRAQVLHQPFQRRGLGERPARGGPASAG